MSHKPGHAGFEPRTRHPERRDFFDLRRLLGKMEDAIIGDEGGYGDIDGGAANEAGSSVIDGGAHNETGSSVINGGGP